MIFLAVLLVYTGIFAGLLAAACQKKYKDYYIGMKSVNSAAFVAVFLIAGAYTGERYHFWLMLPAFFCCFTGDVLLGFYNRYQKKKQFLLGLLIFLCGHILFVRWMCRVQKMTAVDAIFPLAAVGIAYGLTAMKKMHTGKMRPCILIYTFFVAMLFSKGIHIAACEGSVRNLTVVLGAALFLASDISILFLYFYQDSGKKVHIFNLVTYYYGIFLLAVCLLF